MLNEAHRQLLTAYVDGELSNRERRRVGQLLRRSRAARQFLRRLQADSRTLKALPDIPAPTDLADSVLQAIADRNLRPALRPLRVPESAAPLRFPAWAGFALAASVFVAVALGSYFVFSNESKPSLAVGPNPSVTPPDGPQSEQHETKRDVPTPDSPPKVVKQTPVPPPPSVPPPHKPTPRPMPPTLIEPIVHRPEEDDPFPDAPEMPKTPEEKKREVPVLASGGKIEEDRLERVELALPALTKLEDLLGAPARDQLAASFTKGSAFRVEILCHDAAKTVERTKAALVGRHRSVVVESAATARLKKNWKSDYAFFVENLTPAELAALVMQVAGNEKPRLDGTLVHGPMSRWDRQELTRLLGVDPTKTRPHEEGIDIHTPLTEQTQAQVQKALEGKTPRPGAQKNEPALLLALGSFQPKASPEVKRFLETRRPARADTVQVFLVIRNVP
jgi:hypothetical protein